MSIDSDINNINTSDLLNENIDEFPSTNDNYNSNLSTYNSELSIDVDLSTSDPSSLNSSDLNFSSTDQSIMNNSNEHNEQIYIGNETFDLNQSNSSINNEQSFKENTSEIKTDEQTNNSSNIDINNPELIETSDVFTFHPQQYGYVSDFSATYNNNDGRQSNNDLSGESSATLPYSTSSINLKVDEPSSDTIKTSNKRISDDSSYYSSADEADESSNYELESSLNTKSNSTYSIKPNSSFYKFESTPEDPPILDRPKYNNYRSVNNESFWSKHSKIIIIVGIIIGVIIVIGVIVTIIVVNKNKEHFSTTRYDKYL